MLADRSQLHSELQETLKKTLHCERLEGTVIPINKFIEYIIAPHCVNLLIQADLSLPDAGSANAVRLQSKEVGKLLHDEEVVLENQASLLPVEPTKPPKPRPRVLGRGKGNDESM